MVANAISYDPVIKELWPQERVKNLTYQRAPFWAMLTKKTDFTEKVRHIALQHANPQGRSKSFNRAQANVGSSQFRDFEIRRRFDYAVGRIDGDTYESTQDSKAAIVSALDTETRGCLSSLGRSLHRDLFSNGDAVLGQVNGSAPSGETITLATPSDAKNFEVGMTVVSAATLTGSVGGTTTVTNVNRSNGQITFADASAAGIGADDFIFVDGDAQNGAAASLGVQGLASWLPVAGPTSTPFNGVDRTVDATRYAGVVFNADDENITGLEETLIQANAKLDDVGQGSAADVVLMNSRRFGELTSELSSRKEFGYRMSEDGEMSFKTLKLHGATGELDIVSDFQCPYDRFYMLQMDTWCFHSLRDAPRIITHDGLSRLRIADDDGIEFRAVYRGDLVCDAPGWNSVGVWPS